RSSSTPTATAVRTGVCATAHRDSCLGWRPSPRADLLPAALVGLLALAPLARGAVHEWASFPLLGLSFLIGAVSSWRARSARRRGEHSPPVPGWRLLLALHVLVVAQLVPLPPGLLKAVSPGSFAFYDGNSLVALQGYRPISVYPADTARGLFFLAGITLVYASAFRELHQDRWRHRL